MKKYLFLMPSDHPCCESQSAQAENLVKVAAILNAGEIIEEKEEGKDE